MDEDNVIKVVATIIKAAVKGVVAFVKNVQ